jgi:hypothetical protein
MEKPVAWKLTYSDGTKRFTDDFNLFLKLCRTNPAPVSVQELAAIASQSDEGKKG